jgi:hypothetical protein
MKKVLLALFVVFVGSVAVVSAQTKIPLKFPRGTHSTTVSGTVTGYRYKDYILGARAGQTMTVKAVSKHSGLEVVVFRPNGENVEGMLGETEWTGTLPDDGKYTVRVIIVRSAARRGDSAAFRLTVGIQ